ncbi:HET domain-containing protein [Nemania sp. FL0031]|nr:HET domain-containing protein [Nemania sp. FL0031]
MDHKSPQLYSPLPSNMIRLLHLEADISVLNDGNLIVTRLDAAPPYYTLSHCWGEVARDAIAWVNNQSVAVSSDLSSGIRRLRKLAAKDFMLDPPIEYIWIDEICINQDDVQEIAAQVLLMGQLYSRSIKTLIWLGPDPEGEESFAPVWKLVDEIYHVFRTLHPTAKVLDDIPRRMYSNIFHDTIGMPRWTDQRWRGFQALLMRPWFSRLWIVQEVALSPSDPTIIQGNNVYSWHHLTWVAGWMRRNGYIRLSQISSLLLNLDCIRMIQDSKYRWPLDALMSVTQVKFHASDQRDKVFGLVGLSAEGEEPSLLPEPLRPDYVSDTMRVYQKVTRYLLENGGSLAMLTRTCSTNDRLERDWRRFNLSALPSWVQNWSDYREFDNRIASSFSWIHCTDPSKPACLWHPESYKASGTLGIQVHPSTDSKVLRLSGLRVSSVESIVPFDSFDNEEAYYKKTFRKHFDLHWPRLLESALSIANFDLLGWAAQFVSVTTAEPGWATQHRVVNRNWDQTLQDGLAYLHAFLLSSKHHRSLFSFKFGDGALELLKERAEGGDANEYANLAYHFCFNRSFFLTHDKKMGIGPSDMLANDTVVVLFGGGVPYIIRQEDYGWTFVAESYVYGLMNGEALRGKIKEEIFDFS